MTPNIKSFLSRDAFVRTNRRVIAMVFYGVRSSVCPSGTGVLCDHTVPVSAGLSLRLNSSMFWGILTPEHVHLFPAVFFQFHLEERWGMDMQTRRDISRTVEDRG